MKISEIIANKYKLRIPPTVYYELLADVQDAEEEQEPCEDFKRKAGVVIEQLRADRDRLEKELDETCLSIDSRGGWKYKWIPFEEEIPEQGVHILVTTTAGIVTMAFVDSKITEKLSLRMIDPISYRLVEVDNPKEYNITHWAKMPEGYKGEG